MESIIVHPKDEQMKEALLAFVAALKMPFVKVAGKAAGAEKESRKKRKKGKEDEPYDPEFVAKIKQGEKDFAEGKAIRVTLDEIWK